MKNRHTAARAGSLAAVLLLAAFLAVGGSVLVQADEAPEPPAGESPVPSASPVPSDGGAAYYGEWTVDRVAAFAPVGTYDRESAGARVGARLSFGGETAALFGDDPSKAAAAIKPAYAERTLTADEFFAEFRVSFDALGLTADAVTAVEVSGGGIGGTVVLSGGVPALYAAGGTFFGLAPACAADTAPVLSLPLAEYTVSSGYLPSETDGHPAHPAIDLAAPKGAPVLACADGVVTETGMDEYDGRYIRVEHAGGLSSYYAHLSSAAVSEGDAVQRGEAIGAVGSTGASTGPHLHFALTLDGAWADPGEYLGF